MDINFPSFSDDKMGEQNFDYGTGIAVSEGDISMMFSSMARAVPIQGLSSKK